MNKLLSTAALLAGLMTATGAQAVTISYTGGSLQGSSGSIDVTQGADLSQMQVTWNLDSTG